MAEREIEMSVIMFQKRFAPLVENGSKRQTIRLARKRPIIEGEMLSLREWTGKPYRSPQRILRTTTCKEVSAFTLDYPESMTIHGCPVLIHEQSWVAQNDGFQDAAEMRRWFIKTHGLPFKGILIKW